MKLLRTLGVLIASQLVLGLVPECWAASESYIVGIRQPGLMEEFHSFPCKFSSKCVTSLQVLSRTGKFISLSVELDSSGRNIDLKLSDGLIPLEHEFDDMADNDAVNGDFLRLNNSGHANGLIRIKFKTDTSYPLDRSADVGLRALLQSPVWRRNRAVLASLEIVISKVP